MLRISYQKLIADCSLLADAMKEDGYEEIVPIPRGGCVVASYLSGLLGIPLRSSICGSKSVIVDDLIDSGKTLSKFLDGRQCDVAVLYRKPHSPDNVDYFIEEIDDWIEFPYEDTSSDIAGTITRQLEYIGEDPTREGLIETPRRVLRSWEKLCGGYKEDPKVILSTVFNQKYDEMVLLKDIEMYSTCEHHMLPFHGKCHIAYIPNGKVVGISKLARLMECFSRRLQIQERLCNQVVDSMEEFLKPKGCACIMEAQHFCMTSRGVQKQNSIMTTSALRGVFLEKNSQARSELLQLIRR